jgi:hypothetical protein
LVLQWLDIKENVMTAKKKTTSTPKPKKEDPNALKLTQQPAETSANTRAHASLRPTVQAALTLMDYNKCFGDLSINTLVDDLGKQCDLASSGDLKRPEAILTAQAHTLDAIFHTLARRAQRVEYLNQFDTNMRLALKAQAQCRATLETLAEIKNPKPVAFVRQANIAHGPQQVNNGTVQPGEASRARETENRPNELLEAKNGESVDAGTTGTTSSADSPMETVGAVYRPQDKKW